MADAEWSQVASIYQGPRAVGGKIQVSQGRFAFQPHTFDRKTGGRGLDVALTDITRITSTRRSWYAPRRHLRVEMSDGRTVRFLVNKVDRLMARLAEPMRAAGGAPAVD